MERVMERYSQRNFGVLFLLGHLTVLLLVTLILLSGCGLPEQGADALNARTASQPGPLPDCVSCHITATSLDPVTTNATGLDGKHQKHVVEKGIACATCHDGYTGQSSHMNGVMDTENATVSLVSFGQNEPEASWTNDAGPGTGGCANTYCHGGGQSKVDWYSTQGSLACTQCHRPGSNIDPLTINGSAAQGKHLKHAGALNLPCETCHGTYRKQPTHINGIMDAANPAVKLLSFSAPNQSAEWRSDTGPATGDCANSYCHSTQGSLGWYSNITLACTDCHAPGTAMDPIVKAGTGVAGKHLTHVDTLKLACEGCHSGYTGQSTHANGTYEGSAGANLITFSGLNSNGVWNADTGPGTGTCANTYCHGGSGSSIGWTTNQVLTCTSCHIQGSLLDPVITNSSGSAGKHVKHVAENNFDCATCHSGYTGQSTHLNEVMDTGNPSARLVSGFRNPSTGQPTTGSWTGDTGAGTGTCADTACHGPQPNLPQWYGTTTQVCTNCHAPGNTWPGAAPDPLTSQARGTSGKHEKHVSQLGLTCVTCHYNYTNENYHFPNTAAPHGNGRLDTRDTFLPIVRFNMAPSGTWSDPGVTGTCANVGCHGATPMEWYTTANGSWTRPTVCTECHGEGSSLSPAILAGSGTKGKHTRHVTEKGYGCETCHANYLNSSTHINGQFDTANPAATLVTFGAGNPGALWSADTGPETGSCASTYCHGGVNTPNWYTSAAPPVCTDCHSPGSAIDPLVLNGSGMAGKHVKHVTEKGYACTKCHSGYTASATHVNYSREVTIAGVSLLGFDSTNTGAVWSGDAGANTGGCANLYCHGAVKTPAWYTSATPLPCTDCHTAGSLISPLTLAASGTQGKHSTHVWLKNFACATCHGNYRETDPRHGNLMWDTNDPAAQLVRFSSAQNSGTWNPDALWRNDLGAHTGSCANLYCHGSMKNGTYYVPNEPFWYDIAAITCRSCHTVNNPTAPITTNFIDPVVLDTLRGRGQHNRHINQKNISDCKQCHYTISGQGLHVNTLMDADTASTLVNFDPAVNPNGIWQNDTSTNPGVCSNICHKQKSW